MPLDARYSLEVADVDIVTLSLVRGWPIAMSLWVGRLKSIERRRGLDNPKWTCPPTIARPSNLDGFIANH